MADAKWLSVRIRMTFAAMNGKVDEFEAALKDGGVEAGADALVLAVRSEELIRVAIRYASEDQIRAAMHNPKRGTSLSRGMFGAHLARLAGERALATAAA